METQQNPTVPNEAKEVSQQAIEDMRFAALVDFKALNGLRTDEEGNLIKTSMQVFADMLDVNRSTLYDWMKRPGFWDLVNARRKELSSGGRLAKVHETLYLMAVKGEWQHLNAWLINFDPNYRTPTQKVEVDAGDSLMEALALARKRNPELIEGEVVSDSNGSAQ